MRKTQAREIDGVKFEVTQLGARAGQNLSVRLAGLFSGALAQTLRGVEMKPGGKLQEAKIDWSKLGDALPALFARLTPDELERIQTELFAYAVAYVKGQRLEVNPHFDSVFPNAFTPLKLTLFALEVNFDSFFREGLGGRIARLAQQSVSGSSEDSSQSGPSGDS